MPKGNGACSLIYNSLGETTDQDLNLAGRNSVIIFEQAGTGTKALSGTSTYSSPIMVKQGTLRLAHAQSPGKETYS